ncbi:hypothetical protein WJX74_006969 [Apatococcus lobatus]|uniref:Scaffold protein Nfu/NifU N-terminal domain-containing protein n=1 Tax=Apatococcus lobatus TaxID=904363 RepID=A0AAW1RC87_9CHLO
MLRLSSELLKRLACFPQSRQLQALEIRGLLHEARYHSWGRATPLHSRWPLPAAAPSQGRSMPHSAAREAQDMQTRSMFIQTQSTPNPASLMFQPGQPVMGETGSFNCSSARESMASPLAKRLFNIDGVQGIFFGADFVTVTKADDTPWAVLKPDIYAAMMDHFSSGDPLFTDRDAGNASNTMIHDDDSEVVAMIKELLETRIRPAVMEDGGDIVFQDFDEVSGVVVLKMQGACAGCPSSSVTLKSGIENMLMHYIPEVKSVMEADPDEAEQAGMVEFNKLEAKLSV